MKNNDMLAPSWKRLEQKRELYCSLVLGRLLTATQGEVGGRAWLSGKGHGLCLRSLVSSSLKLMI